MIPRYEKLKPSGLKGASRMSAEEGLQPAAACGTKFPTPVSQRTKDAVGSAQAEIDLAARGDTERPDFPQTAREMVERIK
jgi:hypothetical protein